MAHYGAPKHALVTQKSLRERLSRSTVLRQLRSYSRGELKLIDEPQKKIHSFGLGKQTSAYIRIHRSRFFTHFFRFGEAGFKSSYIEGDWSSESLVDVISWFMLNKYEKASYSNLNPSYLRLLDNLFTVQLTTNAMDKGFYTNLPREQPKKFFCQFLGESLNSLPRIFNQQSEAGHDCTQLGNHRQIIERLNLNGSERILEFGCGWGSFTLFTALTCDNHLTALTHSKAQYNFLSEQIRELNLEKKIHLILGDLSSVTGSFDRIIYHDFSGLIESIDPSDVYMNLSKLLESQGLIVLITAFLTESTNEKTHSLRNPIKMPRVTSHQDKHLKTLSQFISLSGEKGHLSLVDYCDDTYNFQKTLESWLQKIRQKKSQFNQNQNDKKAARAWEYAIAYQLASYKAGLIKGAKIILRKT